MVCDYCVYGFYILQLNVDYYLEIESSLLICDITIYLTLCSPLITIIIVSSKQLKQTRKKKLNEMLCTLHVYPLTCAVGPHNLKLGYLEPSALLNSDHFRLDTVSFFSHLLLGYFEAPPCQTLLFPK